MKGHRSSREEKWRTPEEDYIIPLLESLVELGGRARTKDVLDRVYQKMKDQLTEADKEKLPKGQDIRWRNTVQWCRFALVKEGLITPNTPRRTIEITEKGREYLKKWL